MKRDSFHILFLLAVALTVTAPACTRLGSTGNDGLPCAVVDIRTNFPDGEVASKADPAPVAFGGDYGILVCEHDNAGYARFKPATYNVRAAWNQPGFEGKWSFRDVVSYTSGDLFSEASERFFLMGRNDGKTADFYAYSPWVQSAYRRKPTEVPFDRTMDLMYAEENNTGINKGKDPASDEPLSATFTFRHAMARLVFQFKLKNKDDAGSPNTTYYVSLSSLKRSASATGSHLYSRGTFNAITGEFVSLEEVDEVAGGGCYVTRATYEDAFALLLVPTEVLADDELTFTFSCGSHVFPPFVLKREMVLHAKADPGDPDIYGFQAGYTYTFQFTLDNYVRFDGFSISDWTDEELDSHRQI